MTTTSDCCFPVKDLADDAVKLTPFDTVKHTGPYFRGSVHHPELYGYMSIGPFATEEDFVSKFMDGFVNAQSSVTCFAIIDKRKPASPADSEGEVAGMVSYMSASAVHLSADVAYILILPPYQQTHVTTHAVGDCCSIMPSTTLRKAGWVFVGCSGLRIPRTRRRYRRLNGWGASWRGSCGGIGVCMMLMLMLGGRYIMDGDGRLMGEVKDGGRDTAYLSLCWDDWLGGKREMVDALLSR